MSDDKYARYAPPAAALVAAAAANDIDALPVSESWKRKFRLIEKAGGPGLKKLTELPFKE